jgi:hypothetical protein
VLIYIEEEIIDVLKSQPKIIDTKLIRKLISLAEAFGSNKVSDYRHEFDPQQC